MSSGYFRYKMSDMDLIETIFERHVLSILKVKIKRERMRRLEKIKNIDREKNLVLKEQIEYKARQVVSKILAQNNTLSITLFSFDKGEGISTHESEGDAFVTCLDGRGEITIDGNKYELCEGESIVMPARHPHSVFGKEQFKMMLVVVF